MTKNVDIYEMDYSVSPGGINCWEANIHGYGQSVCLTDFKSAGEALNYILDRYPNEMIECNITSLPAYEKEMSNEN